MAEKLKASERLVQVGVTALRGPDGSFLPAVPMYIKVDAKDVSGKTGLSKGEEQLCSSGSVAAMLAEKFKKYMDEVEALERKPGHSGLWEDPGEQEQQQTKKEEPK